MQNRIFILLAIVIGFFFSFHLASADTNISSVACGVSGKVLSSANTRYFISQNTMLNQTCFLNITANGVTIDGGNLILNTTDSSFRLIIAYDVVSLYIANLTTFNNAVNVTLSNVSALTIRNVNMSGIMVQNSPPLNISGNYINIYNLSMEKCWECLSLYANHSYVQDSSFITRGFGRTSLLLLNYSTNLTFVNNTIYVARNGSIYLYNSQFRGNIFLTKETREGEFAIGGNGTYFINNSFTLGYNDQSGTLGHSDAVKAFEGSVWYNNTFTPFDSAGADLFLTVGNNITIDGGTLYSTATLGYNSAISIVGGRDIVIRNIVINRSKTGVDASVGSSIRIAWNATNVLFDNVKIIGSNAGPTVYPAFSFGECSGIDTPNSCTGNAIPSFISNILIKDSIINFAVGTVINSGVTDAVPVYYPISSNSSVTNVTILNTTYPSGLVESLNTNVSNFSRSWYYMAYVNTSVGGALANVLINATGTSGLSYNGTTNSSGTIPALWLAQYIINRNVSTYHNNYSIEASHSITGVNATPLIHSFNMTSITVIDNFQFTKTATTPTLTITNPQNGDSYEASIVPYSQTLAYTVTGQALSNCWYNVTQTFPSNSVEVSTTTISSCGTNTSFSVSALDAQYRVTVCANNTFNDVGCDTNNFNLNSPLPAQPGTPGGGAGETNSPTIVTPPFLDPTNPDSPVYDENYAPGESSGAPNYVSDSEDSNLSWTMQTDGKGNAYTLLISPKSTRKKAIIYQNTGTVEVFLNTTCEGTLCPYLVLDSPNFKLKVGKDLAYVTHFKIDFARVVSGKYTANIISKDQKGNKAVIAVTASVSSAGFLIEIFNKLFGFKTVFGLRIPYAFFFLLLAIFLFISLNFAFKKIAAGKAIAFIVAVLGSFVFLLFI